MNAGGVLKLCKSSELSVLHREIKPFLADNNQLRKRYTLVVSIFDLWVESVRLAADG